jgi:plastocyanin
LRLTLLNRSFLALLVLSSVVLCTAFVPNAAAEDGPSTVYEVRAARRLFDKSSLMVVTGSTVIVRLINEDFLVPHNFGIDVPGVHPSEVCAGPCETSLVFTAPAPGNYQFFCTLHQGMQGDLYVRAQ